MENIDNSHLDYSEVMDDYHTRATLEGASKQDDAWLDMDGVWWPNPHYTGEPVAHPECSTEFHPRKGPSLRERFEAFKRGS